jgi:hypothetical protein
MLPSPNLIDSIFDTRLTTSELKTIINSKCCELNQMNSAQMTPLKAAIINRDYCFVMHLIRAGASVTCDALSFAARYAHKTGMHEKVKEAYLQSTVTLIVSKQVRRVKI